MLEFEPTGQRGRAVTGSGQNGLCISSRRHRGDSLLADE